MTEQTAGERLAAIAALVDEATGYSVPYARGRFMPIDSAFTNALKVVLGVPPGHACVGFDGEAESDRAS